jgi:predicted GNAT family acetyltransferase
MDVRAFDDVAQFARHAAKYLDVDPLSPSVIAVQMDGALRGSRPPGPQDTYWTLVDDGRVVGIAMHTPPHSLFLARMPAEAAGALAVSLADAGRSLPGINGEQQAVADFATTWNQRTGQTWSTTVSMRMYRLTELVVPVDVPGHARPADQDDVPLIGSWLEAFHDEAQPHAPTADWTSQAQLRIKADLLSVWQDGDHAVSMAAFSTAVAGVARVGPVYTPPAHRRRGYGAAVTAGATAAAIGRGAKQVVLYTNLANPTSNAIYQAIGYRPDHDAEERAFT